MRPNAKLVSSLCVFAAFVVSVISAARHVEPNPADFGVRYAAGAVARSGHDPYKASNTDDAIVRITGRYYPDHRQKLFLDPPPVAGLFALVSFVPFRVAVWSWFVGSIAASVAIALLTASVFRFRLTSAMDVATVGALGLAFGPLRYGVAGVQLDPMFAVAAMGALALSVRRRGGDTAVGALGVAGLLKPQLGLLPMLTTIGRSTRRVVAAAVSVALLATLTAIVVPSASWPRWIGALSPGHTIHSSSERVVLSLVLVASVWVWTCARRFIDDEVVAFSAAATLGVVAFALVHLNPFSAVLLIVPTVLATQPALEAAASRGRQFGTAVVVGALAAGAVAPATVYGGTHAAAFPILTAAFLAAAAWLRLPHVRPFVAIAFATNAVLVLSSLTAPGTRLLVSVASLGLALLIASAMPRRVATSTA